MLKSKPLLSDEPVMKAYHKNPENRGVTKFLYYCALLGFIMLDDDPNQLDDVMDFLVNGNREGMPLPEEASKLVADEMRNIFLAEVA